MCVCVGDTRALCDDMKDFAHDYIDYINMAKQLIPEINTVQHWSKIIETKYVLRSCSNVFVKKKEIFGFYTFSRELMLSNLDIFLF